MGVLVLERPLRDILLRWFYTLPESDKSFINNIISGY